MSQEPWSKDGGNGSHREEEQEIKNWITHHLGEDTLERLQEIQVKYELGWSLDDVIFTSLLLLVLLEQKGPLYGLVSSIPVTKEKVRVTVTLTSLETFLDEARQA